MTQFGLIALCAAALAACAQVAPARIDPAAAPGALPIEQALDGREIVARAHAAAGGDAWVHPRSLHMIGEGVFYAADGRIDRHERYEMWRVYPAEKSAAHAADGRVRIQSWRNGETALLLAFDGVRSYTAAGPQPPSEADRQWSENFGFGVIRYALDDGFSVARMPDDLVDARAAYVVRITDPHGQQTVFSIAQDDYAILRVGFATPRGWHERTYSDFFTRPGVSWVQPGRVRLTYNGVKQNEIFWRDFSVNEAMPDDLFAILAPGD
ncbi:MAG: hypothetical protein GC206_14970 [Alphaproteobacteria bacterium]|nr:hypothetical protein [Alphaproteobacteria bacterium]